MLKLLQSKRYSWRRYNYPLLIIIMFLFVISIVALVLSQSNTANAGLPLKQGIGIISSLFLVLFISIIDYHFICRYSIIIYLIGTALVAAARYSPLGMSIKGARRWLDFKFVQFQPTDICKITLIIALAVFFYMMKEKLNKFSTLILAVLITAFPTFFIMKQPNLSSSLVMMFILGMMVLASGITYKILIPIIAVLLPTFLGVFWYIQQPGQRLLTDYQLGRIVGFLDPEKYNQETMWQQNHSVLAIASGKVYGKLLLDGPSNVRVYRSFDVTESDFIWSVISEEFGFIGCIVILVLLITIVILCLIAAKRAQDYLGMMIATGIASMFAFQIFANIGVATRILPNTGLPLPFLSYGLSALWGNMIAIGLIINIGIQPSRPGGRYNSFNE